MRLTSLLMLFLVISFMIVGNQLYNSDKEYGVTRDIHNFTEERMVWNSSLIEEAILSDNPNEVSGLNRIIYKFTDFVGYTFIEGGKMSLEFGYNNPQYNFDYWIQLLKFYLIVVVIVTIIPVIIPLLAVLFIILNGIVNLFKRLNRKEDRKNV